MEINFKDGMNLGIQEIYGRSAVEVKSVTFDSRRVEKYSAFICIKGEHFDGHSFIEKAVEQEATVILGDNKSVLKDMAERFKDRTFIYVTDSKIASARLSSLVYGACEKKLKTIAVTGTNGKTTVTAYMKSLLNLLGVKTGSIGTLGITSSTETIEYKKSTPTTPEAPDLHYIFQQLYSEKEEAVAMEVSSIAIEEKRVEGIQFDVGIHTNLSPEHLEYHHDFESYKQAKLKLFDQVKTAVVNIDDEGMSKEILDNFQGPVITYSLSESTTADLIAANVVVTKQGCNFELRAGEERYAITTPILGSYNLANLLAVIGAAVHLGYKLPAITRVLPDLETPEGRFQLVETEANRTVILDYAHTPVALDNLLTEVRKLPHNRLIVLLTGIGIRDFGKMPRMAETMEGRAEEIVVSVDHPGFHDPQEIINQVLTGFADPDDAAIHQALTRKEGVLKCLSLSDEGDIILLTSGCINGSQIVGDEYIPHSDEEIVESYIARLIEERKKTEKEASCAEQGNPG